MSEVQLSKLLKIGFFFKPFSVPLHGQSLAQSNVLLDDELILIRRADRVRTLLAREMAYHHVAQGELAGQPYLVTF